MLLIVKFKYFYAFICVFIVSMRSNRNLISRALLIDAISAPREHFPQSSDPV